MLGEFLKSRRAKVSPEDVGLPSSGQRRVPGLRREELAHLAGVSVDYYVRLEQGRAQGVSDEVLHALAEALRLDDDERAYLFTVARPVRTAPQPKRPVATQVRYLLDAMPGVPAYVIDHRADVLAWNELAAALMLDFGALPREQRNWARLCLLDERTKEIFVDWEGKARETVAYLRLHAAHHANDPRIAAVVGELSVKSEQFRQWWADHNVQDKTAGIKRIRHPLVGELLLHFQTMSVTGSPGQSLVAYTAEPGSPDEQALQLLTSWTLTDRTQGATPPTPR